MNVPGVDKLGVRSRQFGRWRSLGLVRGVIAGVVKRDDADDYRCPRRDEHASDGGRRGVELPGRFRLASRVRALDTTKSIAVTRWWSGCETGGAAVILHDKNGQRI